MTQAHPIFNTIKSLYPYAYSLCKSYDDTMDILQEVNLFVFRNLKTVPETDAERRRYLMFYIKRRFINKYRYKKTREKFFRNYSQDTQAVSIEKRYEDQEKLQTLRRHIQTMKPRHQDVFNMAIVGYKYEEIAERLDVNLGTVKTIINTCRHRMVKFAQENNL